MASHRRPSSTVNPFDSDEDDAPPPSSRPYSNPFDDDPSPPSKPLRTAPRPGRSQESRPDPKPSAPAQRGAFDTRNPFDDDSPPALRSKPGNPPPRAVFADDLKPQADLRNNGHDERPSARKSGMSQMRDRAAATGDAALRKAQKFKDAGVNQASKALEGSLAQAQKLKGSSYNAFKSNEGNEELNRGKPKSQSREQLLGGEGEGLFKTTRDENTTRTRYDDSQFQSGDLEYKSVQELEGYALQKSEETTQSVQNSLRVAEEIKGDATKTLLTLHEQGEQIKRTHDVAVDIDLSLSSGEKLLGSLGGMFSRTWKPKKGRPVTGPVVIRNDSFKRRGHHLEQRVALGLVRSPKGRNNRSSPDTKDQSHLQTTQAKLDNERIKQDDALSDLSNVLDQLKGMSLDMGLEISRQNTALDHLQDDVITLDERVKGANVRGRRLLGK